MSEEQMNVLDVPVVVSVSWSDSDVAQQAAAMVYEDIKRDVVRAIHDNMKETLQKVVNTALQGVLEGVVQPTNKWGEPTSEPICVKELLMRDAIAWLTERVDQYGSSDSNSYSKKQTRAQYLFKKTISEDFTAHVKKVIAENITDVDALIAAEVEKQLRAKLK